jgi:soluble lytic murein transglycosylase-like protein
MLKHLCLGLIAFVLTTSAQFANASEQSPAAPSIIAVRENGRTVYVNNETVKAPVKVAPRRHSVLVYWSRSERRWKPVPPPTPSAMRAARTAAAEVASYVASQPRTGEGLLGASASTDPNYRQIARGYQVSAASIDSAIEEAAARHNVDPNLVRAIIKVESNFNPQAVSRKGAMGLMQLMPTTARQLNLSNPFDPRQNVDAGVRHLKVLLNNYDGDLKLTLAAYNAGQGAVARSNGVPRYRETQTYVKRITDLYWTGGLPAGASSPQSLRVAGRSPIRTFRSKNGVLHITNE